MHFFWSILYMISPFIPICYMQADFKTICMVISWRLSLSASLSLSDIWPCTIFSFPYLSCPSQSKQMDEWVDWWMDEAKEHAQLALGDRAEAQIGKLCLGMKLFGRKTPEVKEEGWEDPSPFGSKAGPSQGVQSTCYSSGERKVRGRVPVEAPWGGGGVAWCREVTSRSPCRQFSSLLPASWCPRLFLARRVVNQHRVVWKCPAGVHATEWWELVGKYLSSLAV